MDRTEPSTVCLYSGIQHGRLLNVVSVTKLTMSFVQQLLEIHRGVNLVR